MSHPDFDEILIQIRKNKADVVYSALEKIDPIPLMPLAPKWKGVRPQCESIKWLEIKIKEFLLKAINDGLLASDQAPISIDQLSQLLLVKSGERVI